MSQPKFTFYEKVRVCTSDPKKFHLNGEIGVILGMAETEDENSWYYVLAIRSEKYCRCFYEHELEPTGEYAKREDFYDGTSIRVQVDERGRGSIMKPDETNVRM
jgi:hypothetical protein